MISSLAKSSAVFSIMTLISRVLGLLRDMLIARYFGVTITDPFFAALRIPNTLRRFFAEGGFANAFVPVFSATRSTSPAALTDLLRYTSGTLLGILLVITILGVFGAGGVIFAVAHGLTAKPEQFLLAKEMLAILFPYILLISLTAMAGGILNTFGYFSLPALTPVFLNITLIMACVWRAFYADSSGIELAWAVLIGGIIQLAIQLPLLWKLKLLVMPRWGFYHAGVQKILRLMIPTLFGSSVGQLTVLMNTFLASMLATGSISWLYYSDRMVELPIALIGVALGTVILPKLSALKAQNNETQFTDTLIWALRWGLLIGSAASTGLVMLAPSILVTLFYGGNFLEHDVLMTTMSLRAYGCAAVFLVLVKILAPAFYARQDTKTPVKAGIVAMATNIMVAVLFSRLWGHVGLALASSVAAVVNVALLFYFLYREGRLARFSLKRPLFQIVTANSIMALFLYYLQGSMDTWLSRSTGMRVGYLGALIMIGIVIYVISLYAVGVRWRQLRKG